MVLAAAAMMVAVVDALRPVLPECHHVDGLPWVEAGESHHAIADWLGDNFGRLRIDGPAWGEWLKFGKFSKFF